MAPSNLTVVTRGRRALAAAVAGLTLLACGGDDDDSSSVTVPVDEGTTTTTERRETTTTDPDAALEVEVEQAYYDQWDAYLDVLANPDPTNPLIDRHFAGRIREQLLDTISRFVRDGHVARRPTVPSEFKPTVESIELRDQDEAVVVECLVDGIQIVHRASGEVVNDTVSYLRLRDTFVYQDESWKLADSEVVEEMEDDAKCNSS